MDNVILVEPLLRNQSGHQFAHTVVLQSEFARREINVLVLGNIAPDEDCSKINNLYPVLTDVTSEVFRMGSALGNVFRVFKLMDSLSEQFADFFFSKINLRKQKGTVLLLFSFYIFELLAFGWFLKKNSQPFINNNHKIIIGLNFTRRRKTLPATLIMTFLFKHIFANLVKRVSSQIIYFSADEAIRSDYEKLLGSKVNLLHSPVNNEFLEKHISGFENNAAKDKITISYVGGARYNKGFDLFVGIVEELLKREDMRQKILLSVQIDINKLQPEQDIKITNAAVNKIENLAKKFENIKLIKGTLPLEKYYELLAKSDMVFLLYRKDFYKTVVSNIFREIVVCGNLPIVSKGTLLASELSENNLDDLIIDSESIGPAVDTIKNIVENINAYKLKIQKLQKQWASYYSVSDLVDKIMALAA